MNNRTFRFKKIDAFATATSGGNPAGTIWLDSDKDITEEGMQRIAREMKGFVSEVGYIHRMDEELYGLKYYSSEREVNFCGHATIALMYELFSTDEELQGKEKVTISTNNGELDVENRISSDNAVFIMSPSPKELPNPTSPDSIAENLGIDRALINSSLPVEIIDAGLKTLIVPIVNLEGVLGIAPDYGELKNFCLDGGFDIIEVFSGETYSRENNYRVRVFAPTFGYLEDPATGSGNSAFGYYLIQNNLWKKGTITIEQNSFPENYNVIKLQQKQDSEGRERVIFGGGAVKRIDGEYYI